MLIILCCAAIYIASVFLCRWIIILDIKLLCDKDTKNVKKMCNYFILCAEDPSLQGRDERHIIK